MIPYRPPSADRLAVHIDGIEALERGQGPLDEIQGPVIPYLKESEWRYNHVHDDKCRTGASVKSPIG